MVEENKKLSLDGPYKESWAKKHPILVIIIIVTCLFIFFGVFDNNKTDKESKLTQQPTNIVQQNNIPDSKPDIKEFSLGESIKAGDFEWKVNSISKENEIGEYYGEHFLGKEANGIFLILDVEVSNLGNSAQYLSDSYAKLIDSQGREFSPDAAAGFYLKPAGSNIVFESINPGIVRKAKIVYDVPSDANIVDLRISSNLVEDSFYKVKLII